MGSDSGAKRHGIDATVREDSRPPTVGAPSGFAEGEQVAGRFVVNRALGRGSSGEVLAVQDLALDREVAMKVLRGAGGPAIARFMREARITARLDHPGIPPVHGLEFLPDGGLLFTMRKLEGMTLGDAIRRAAVGEPPPAIASINAVVNLGLRVCEALSRAHFIGVVHCDVKPDNIMLGAHGEVALVDWGECRLADEPPVQGGSTVGTPAYMSPEQARGESPDRRSDIYALGATLFHALSGRLPTFDEEPERFWEKKRRGEIDELPPDIRARIPPPLRAIVGRALAPVPADRYDSASDFAADLERFQAGQAVEAYRESALERILRWLRRHRRDVLAAAAILLICLAAGVLLWREHQRGLADWGPPLVVEDFSDDTWKSRWQMMENGGWEVVDGRLETIGSTSNRIVFKQALGGAVAIEYDAEFAPGSLPGDLSVFWEEELEGKSTAAPGAGARGYSIQAGAFDNYHCQLARQPALQTLDRFPLRLAPGVRHRFRVELDGARLGMWVDGRQVLRADEELPITVGKLGIYGHYPGKRFDNIRIYQKRLPQVVSVLSLGDAFLHRHQYLDASASYRQVMESHPGTGLALEARFRHGLAERLGGNLVAMEAAWAGLPAGEIADRALVYRIEDLIASRDDERAADLMYDLWTRRPDLRSQLRVILIAWLVGIRESDLTPDDERRAEIVLRLKLQRLPVDPGSDASCAELLVALGRLEDAVRHVPDDMMTCTNALINLGRAEEALQRFADSSFTSFRALRDLGRFDEVLKARNLSPWMQVVILCLSGRAEEAARIDPSSSMALRHCGRFAEALDKANSKVDRALALAGMGRTDEALPYQSFVSADLRRLSGREDPRRGGMAGHQSAAGWRMVELDRLGETVMRDALRARLRAGWPNWSLWVAYALVDPLLEQDATLLKRRLEEMREQGRTVASQRPWYLASFALGHLDEAGMRSMPCAAEYDLWLAVGRALRHTLAGERGAAQQAWRDYLALDWWRRTVGTLAPDPALDALARRLAEPVP